MKKLALAALFAVASYAGSWTGYISDAKCGAKHADGSEKSVACAKACVKKGGAPVLVVGDKVIPIDAASREKILDHHVGRRVTIVGKLQGDSLSIEIVSPVS